MFKKLFKFIVLAAVVAVAGLVLIQFDGPRNFLKDHGVDL